MVDINKKAIYIEILEVILILSLLTLLITMRLSILIRNISSKNLSTSCNYYLLVLFPPLYSKYPENRDHVYFVTLYMS